MKFIHSAVVALALGNSAVSFQLGPKYHVPSEEKNCKQSSEIDRRSFFSSSLIIGSAGLLSPFEPAHASYYKDGKRVDRFGRPIPLYESLRADLKTKIDSNDPKYLAEAKEREAKEEEARIEAEKKEEERLSLLRKPPDAPRVLVLGGTGTVGKEVRSKLEEQGIFVVATSRDGRGNTVELDVTKCYGKIEREVFELAQENRCSAVVSLIGGIGSDNDGLVNGATGQAALGASQVQSVRNFVSLGPSTSITTKVPKGLESYVKAKQLSQEIVMSTFKPDPTRDGLSYTIINPGAIGKSKNYGSDPSVPLETVVNAVIVGATGFYLGESSSAVLENIEEIKEKASKISKVKALKASIG